MWKRKTYHPKRSNWDLHCIEYKPVEYEVCTLDASVRHATTKEFIQYVDREIRVCSLYLKRGEDIIEQCQKIIDQKC